MRLTLRMATVSLMALLAVSAMAAPADKKPDRAAAARLNNLGVAFLNQQLPERALAKFDEARQQDPGLTTAELNRGIALLSLQKLPEAEQALKHVTMAEPANARAWYNLGLVHRGEAKYEEGVEDFKQVIKADPDDADARYLLGSLYLQSQKYDLAIVEFEAALRLNRLHASAEFGLARALQRSGRPEDARAHLKNFEHLTHEKISTPMTAGYGEQGRYSVAEDVYTGEPAAAAMIAVKFTAQELAAPGATAKPAAPTGKAPGAGVCLLDVNGDTRPDLVVLRDGDPALQIFLNQGSGQFKPAPAEPFGLALKGRAISCAAGDFDNDGRTDLAVALDGRLVLFRNSADGKFTDVTKAAGIEPLNHPSGLLFVDFDHAGDLDLFVTGSPLSAGPGKPAGSANVLWRNNGNGTFTNWTVQAGISTQAASTEAVLSDLNNDRAVDLLTTGDAASPAFYSNLREGNFRAAPLFSDALPPTVGVAIFDFNKDGWMDVAFTHAGALGVTLWKNIDGKRFERVPLPVEGATSGWGITTLDFDNDGWIDLAAVVESAKGSQLRVLRNLGAGGFDDVTAKLGLDQLQLRAARTVVASDLDGDNDSDLLLTQVDGPTLLLRNDGGNHNRALRIVLTGLADNKSAIGTKVEVFAEGLWQKWELGGASGYLGQGANEILAGLGTHARADIIRMLWPTGVIQDEIDVALEKPAAYTELDRRGSSCPTLFAWDGARYQFISDVIGAAVVGHWISPTERNIADPDEWVKIDGSQLQARNGAFSLRFGEPMEEVNYLDQVRLIAVDHPEGTEVYPNEHFLSAPPFPDGRPIVSAAARPPAGAWDSQGNDVLDLLRTSDRRYVRDFANLTFAGYANLHRLTLDLGPWTEAAPLRLFLHGYIEYFTATSMYAAWQAGIDPIAPYVEAEMPNGEWNRVIDDMGFPAGLPRMIVVDLTGKLPAGTRRIRITSNLQIYWDQALLDNGPDSAQMHVTELPLTSANLAFRGYPRQVELATPGDLTYVYEQVSQTGPFTRQRGSYTRYGEVGELLNKIDNHFAIFGSGEDIDLEFDATSLPAPPAGWKRDYFFYANGFVKDMDFYEASPFTVAELPFQKMSAYPYPATEHYPDDPAAIEYLLNWNDRFDAGKNDGAIHQFNYRSRP